MAILASFPGVSVSVLTAGSSSPLPEYACPEDDASIPAHLQHKTTTVYIQSNLGQAFTFKLDVRPPYLHDCPMLGFDFIIDGVNDGGAQLCHPDMLDRKKCWECVVPGWEIWREEDGESKLFEFRFAELRTNELNPEHLPDEEVEEMKQLGMVEVKVFRHKNSQTKKPRKTALSKGPKEVPEKILKGQSISHRAELGAGKRLRKEAIQQHRALLDGDNFPIGVFRFKYRSKLDLQKMFIIARTPSPSPPPPPVFEDLEGTEVLELAKVAHGKKQLFRRMLSRQRREEFVANIFDALSEDEKTALARTEYISITGGPPAKMESGTAAQAVDAAAGQKRKRAVKVTRMENGKLLFGLDSDDDNEDPPLAPTCALAADERAVVEDDDDVVFVRAHSTARGRRAEGESAGSVRVKDEGPN